MMAIDNLCMVLFPDLLNVISDDEKGGSVLYVKLMLMENVWQL